MNKMLKQRFPAHFKILVDEAGGPTGEVEFYASVFNNVDLIGDRVKATAFDLSLQKWQAGDAPFPIVFAHNWDDAWAIIGYADPKNMSIDDHGLKIRCMLDITTNPYAKQIFSLMLRGIVREASFAYDVVDEKTAKDGANDLNVLDLIEAGPCLKGMNPEAGTISVKTLKEVLEGAPEGILEFTYTIDGDGNLKLGDPTVHFKGAYDDGAWDGPAALGHCKSAADFKAIAFERDNDSDPATAAHYALPHHTSPGAPPNEKGVSAALGALAGARGGAPDLKNAAADKSHLEKHKASIDAENSKMYTDTEHQKVGARHSATDRAAIQGMHDSLVQLGAECMDRTQPEDIGDPVDTGKSADGIKAVSSSSGEETHVSEEKAAETEEVKTDVTDTAEEKAIDDNEGEVDNQDDKDKTKATTTDEDDVETKDAMDGEDDVDADGDGDAGKPAEAEESADAFDSPQTKADDTSTDADEDDVSAKAEEHESAKAKERERIQMSAKVALLELDLPFEDE